MTFNQVVAGSSPACLIQIPTPEYAPGFLLSDKAERAAHACMQCREAGVHQTGGLDGIGRHAGFRFLWVKPCGFKSHRPHTEFGLQAAAEGFCCSLFRDLSAEIKESCQFSWQDSMFVNADKRTMQILLINFNKWRLK